MKNKTINELTSLENPRLTDTLPIWDGTEGKTKKVSLAKIPANVITPVDSLPESPNILDRVYRYNNKYYVGNESAQTLTELASKADIPTVVDAVADGNMNPVTSNAVYDYPIDSITDGEHRPPTSKAVNDALTDGTKELIVDSIRTTGQYQGSGSGLFLGKQDSNLEGGQLTLEHPTSSNFDGDVVMDIWGNSVRFFASYNGSVKTFYIDFDNKTFGFE